jgi:hypothetical protein
MQAKPALVPMSDANYLSFRATAIPGFAADKIAYAPRMRV